MTAQLIDGKLIAQQVRAEVAVAVATACGIREAKADSGDCAGR